jgi:hypothetical protein
MVPFCSGDFMEIWPSSDIVMHYLNESLSYSTTVDTEGNKIGILLWHNCSDSKPQPSPSGILFDSAPAKFSGPRWQLIQENPLTINPSILCRGCGLHGFIRQGKWVDA